jgi:D-3-phosphoglycerate dehydrogenase
MRRLATFVIDKFSPKLQAAAEFPYIDWNYIPTVTPEKAINDYLPLADILIFRSKIPLNARNLAQAPLLKLVIRGGSGVEHIDKSALAERNIKLIATPAGNRDAVGEHAIGLLLCLFNNIARANSQLKAYHWEREANRGYEIMGKTIGILGYGNTGSAVAQKLAGFGARVISYDKYKKNFSNSWVEEVSLDVFFMETDVLSIHIPLDFSNFHFVDADFLSRFRKPIWLLNLARGEVLDSKAALDALDQGKIIGMGLDVFENEDLATLTSEQKSNWERYTRSDRILLTPHIGGWTYEAEERIASLVLEALAENALSLLSSAISSV